MILATVIEDIQQIQAHLFVLAPVVVFVSSLILGPEASERVKVAVPTVISIAAVVATFLATEIPGDGAIAVANVVGNVAVVTGLAVSLYRPISAILVPGDQKLNDVTGPGLPGLR